MELMQGLRMQACLNSAALTAAGQLGKALNFIAEGFCRLLYLPIVQRLLVYLQVRHGQATCFGSSQVNLLQTPLYDHWKSFDQRNAMRQPAQKVLYTSSESSEWEMLFLLHAVQGSSTVTVVMISCQLACASVPTWQRQY